ncbi:MAG: hypothetical protein ACK2UA_09380 [Anaerolineae bacterium]|jgi:hypothetical protein
MGPQFDLPAIYRIQIKGYLDDSWSDRLGGMEIKVIEQAEDAPETILVGWLPDQAALCGVINALYNLNLALLSVELIGSQEVQ